MLRLFPPQTAAEKGISAYGLALIYLKLNAAAQAEKCLLEALRMADLPERDLHTFVFLADLRLCQLYAEKKQYAKARSYLNQGFRFAAQSPKLRTQAHIQAFKLDSVQGNLASAIRHYQQYRVINDSIFSEKKSNQLLGFQVRYETQQKEQALRLKEKNIALLRQQSNVQQARLDQRQTVRNALLGGTGLLALLLGVGFNRYRLKQRSNLQLEAHQEEMDHKNGHLSELLQAQDSLMIQKDLLLLEKEWLLKEIHHRVKNNLQIIMSLLNSQAASLRDKAALSAIQESQHRVQAMSLIHQKLYQSESVARVPMPAYIQEVVDYLHESYNLPQAIGLELDIDDIELDVTLAVPLGLIINEALTNAFKYAFPLGRPGTISISLRCLDPSTYGLTIADDGVGLPASYEPAHSHSLGMTLLQGFSEQLDGELRLTGPPGLTIRLVFAREHLMPTSVLADYAT
jgi:two-component sensor histidine kinase